jgi:hypothetical protein
MRDNNQNIFCSVYDQKTKEFVKVSFVDKWMKDPTIKKYYGILFDPSGMTQGYYNTWPGYKVQKLPPIIDKSTIPALLEPIRYHINEIIANGDPASATWILHWVSHMFQRPHIKTGRAVSFYGGAGSGKTVLMEWIALELMGEGVGMPASMSSNPNIDIVGRFATSLVDKIFVMSEEQISMKEHASKLKDIINGAVLRCEVKGKTKISVKNYANLCLTSNDEDTLPIESDDRRYVLFETNPRHVGDNAYFTALRAHIARKDVQRAFYEHCMAEDLSIYDAIGGFQNSKIVTPFYKRMRDLNLPPFIRFLGALVKQRSPTDEFKATSATVFQMYLEYMRRNGLEDKTKVLNPTLVGSALTALKCAKSKKVRPDGIHGGGGDARVRGWTIIIGELKAELVSTNRYVEDDDTAI